MENYFSNALCSLCRGQQKNCILSNSRRFVLYVWIICIFQSKESGRICSEMWQKMQSFEGKKEFRHTKLCVCSSVCEKPFRKSPPSPAWINKKTKRLFIYLLWTWWHSCVTDMVFYAERSEVSWCESIVERHGNSESGAAWDFFTATRGTPVNVHGIVLYSIMRSIHCLLCRLWGETQDKWFLVYLTAWW